MTPQFKKFRDTLDEIFMLDHAELDFGICRIMNQKRENISVYLNTELEKQVQAELQRQSSSSGDAISYEGEEVKLHWANAYQYYIKTSEYFQNYTFKTGDGRTVNFRLRDASKNSRLAFIYFAPLFCYYSQC